MRGLACSCFLPSWARYRAYPKRSSTGPGRDRKSRFELPTQYSGFRDGGLSISVDYTHIGITFAFNITMDDTSHHAERRREQPVFQAYPACRVDGLGNDTGKGIYMRNQDKMLREATFRRLCESSKQFIYALLWHPVDEAPFAASAAVQLFQRMTFFIAHLLAYRHPVLRFKDVLPHRGYT